MLGLSHSVIRVARDLGAYASPAAVGVSINAASGLVESVTPGSAAAAAGLQKGDRVDFARTGPLMHLWLWDGWFPVQKAVALPVLRSGQPIAPIVVARVSALDAGRIAYDLLSLVGSGAHGTGVRRSVRTRRRVDARVLRILLLLRDA